jgi:hypothetical protein
MRQAGLNASKNKSFKLCPISISKCQHVASLGYSLLSLSLSLSLSQSSSDREASSSTTGLFLRSKTIIMPPKGNRCGGRLQNKHLLRIHKLVAPN